MTCAALVIANLGCGWFVCLMGPWCVQALALERLKNKNAHTSLSARLFPAFDLAMWTALVQTILLALSLEGHIGWDWQWLGLPLWYVLHACNAMQVVL